MKRTILRPKSVAPPPPHRYSHAAIVEAKRLMVVAGQISLDRKGKVIGPGNFKRQFNQVYANLGAILREYGASFHDVVQFTTYLVNSRDLPLFHQLRAQLYRKIYPKGDCPVNTLLVIDRLVFEDLLLEIEALVALD